MLTDLATTHRTVLESLLVVTRSGQVRVTAAVEVMLLTPVQEYISKLAPYMDLLTRQLLLVAEGETWWTATTAADRVVVPCVSMP